VTLLGVLGLLITLIFNAIGVWKGAQQDEQRRETEQIGLVTQLQSSAIDTERAVVAGGAAGDAQCAGGLEGSLDAEDAADLRATLGYYENLAWLFNDGRLTVKGSRRFFSVRMIDGLRLAWRYLGKQDVSDTFPELTEFARRTPAADRRKNICDRIR
jgi:hypothetical protein